MESNLLVITGASRGLGEAFVNKALEQGYECWALARGDIKIKHKNLKAFQIDLSDLLALDAWCHDYLSPALKSKRKLSGVINNAGRLGPMGSRSNSESYAQTLRLNVVAPIKLMNDLAKFSAAESSFCVNISSGAAHNAYPGWLEYCSSKAALSMASEVTAKEFDSGMYNPTEKLSVIEYAPGVVNTDMQKAIREEPESNFPNRDKFVGLHDDGALVDPAETANYLFARLPELLQKTHSRIRYGD